MRYTSLLVAAVLTVMAALLPLFPSSASASSTSPTISSFSPAQGLAGTTVTIKGTNLVDATSVRFGKTAATVIVDDSTKIKVLVPIGATTSYLKVTTPGGLARSASRFVVSLSGVMSLASSGRSYCAVLTSGGVDCWGFGHYGQLGDGIFHTFTTTYGSAYPEAVLGVGGQGTLRGVVSLASAYYSYCALLTSGGVDCWGDGADGQLGDGHLYTGKKVGSAVPVAVLGVGGSGTLGGVASLVSNPSDYCALLTSGGVDCWGYGAQGELGDGTFYATAPFGSAVPVAVLGVGGSGTLGGVASLVNEAPGGSMCALLNSGGVDCWGYGAQGELGDGTFYATAPFGSAVPVAVLGVGGSGTLGGVVSLVNDGDTYCAVLFSGGVDCWGEGDSGELGDGSYDGSAVPVAVLGVGGGGTLGDVASLVHGAQDLGYCALLTSGGVDCWGDGFYGQLGDGTFYTTGDGGSAVPVVVLGVGGSGTFGGVTSLATDGNGQDYCAVLGSGGVDCWGEGYGGQLGDGSFYEKNPNGGSAVPVAVLGVGRSGTLGGVASLTSEQIEGSESYCALLTSGGVDCWGYGYWGQLGDGAFYPTGYNGSAVPVEVATS